MDYIVSGGGARNATLMAMLARRLEPLGATRDERGVRHACGSQGGRGLCAAGVANLASVAGQCARGHGGEAAAILGQIALRRSLIAIRIGVFLESSGARAVAGFEWRTMATFRGETGSC